GESLLRGVPALADLIEPVGHHHERWDGGGYPRGLAGEAVPLLGRIVAVAEAYGGMVDGGARGPRLSPAQAASELRAGAGTRFDPELAELLAQAVERRARPSRCWCAWR